jgi:transcription elongation factor GreA-like protein/transcription elongation GreA/GreB family factor
MTDHIAPLQKQIQTALSQKDFAAAADLWMKAAEEFPDQPETLLLLTKEFAAAGATREAADLLSLIAPTLRKKENWRELLWALQQLARLAPRTKDLRQQLIEAYTKNFTDDPRLQTILNTSRFLEPSSALEDCVNRADALLALKEGMFCQHKSWGFGRVVAFDTALGVLRVDFKAKSGHSLQLDYAADSLTPLPADHIAVRKATDLPALKTLATEQPLVLLRCVLHSFGGSATQQQIEAELCPEVVAADQWKRWWDNAKKQAKKDPHISVPAKKTDPFELREAPLTVQEEFAESFAEARGLKQRIGVAQELLRMLDEISDAELLLQEFVTGIVASMRQAPSAERELLFTAAAVAEELRSHQKNPATVEYPPQLTQLCSRADSLVEHLESVPLTFQSRALELARRLCGEQWSDIFLRALPKMSHRLVDQVATMLVEAKLQERLRDAVRKLVVEQTASADLCLWLCRVRGQLPWEELFESLWGQRLFLALIAALNEEKSRAGSTRYNSRLLEFMSQDKELIADLLETAATEDARDAARNLLASPAIEELTRRSLIARIIKLHPEVQSLLDGGAEEPAESRALIVSWPSYERLRAELDEIVNKKIPENSKAIAAARAYGDLSENFEYKAAKEAHRMLQKRRSQLERDLDLARPTYFDDTPADRVGIGSCVTVTELPAGKTATYYILGAWDTNPQRGIISYRAPVARALMDKTVGDEVDVELEQQKLRLRVDKTEKTPKQFLETL